MMQWLNWVLTDTSRSKDLDNISVWLERKTTLACQACSPPLTVKQHPVMKQIRESNRKNQEQKKSPTYTEEDCPTAVGLFVDDKSKCIC